MVKKGDIVKVATGATKADSIGVWLVENQPNEAGWGEEVLLVRIRRNGKKYEVRQNEICMFNEEKYKIEKVAKVNPKIVEVAKEHFQWIAELFQYYLNNHNSAEDVNEQRRERVKNAKAAIENLEQSYAA